MSNGNEELACYSFLPWLRQGIANNIKTAPAAGKQRASINVSIDVESDSGLNQTLTNSIQLIGPGDIIGLSERAIVRAEPKAWATDFEPNFLPFIEFYDEDLPWRYSPMPADAGNHHITPWLTLVVLVEGEFTHSAQPDSPLPFIDINGDALSLFPNFDQLWGWAHVHVNMDLKNDSEGNPVGIQQSVAKLEQLLDTNPDLGYSRLLCPRKLQPATDYHAFLIPTFESGRLAGLGQEIPTSVSALDCAWGATQARFPFYHRWYFRTGERGDFEFLVRLLKPRAVDERVGIRDMDVSAPGAGIDGIDMGSGNPSVIGMEGALKSPQTQSTDWPNNYAEPFQQQLSVLINKADDYQQANPDSDPVITPPLYGRWHALRKRLSLDKDTGSSNPYDPQRKWLTETNLDPRWRASSGLGTRVVQHNQEHYMDQAWQQIGDVLEANRRLKLAQFAEMASRSLYKKHYMKWHANVALSITQPVHRRVLGSEETVYSKIKNSPLPMASMSLSFRRVLRPRGAVARRVMYDQPLQVQPEILHRINSAEITATPAKKLPAGVASLVGLSDSLTPVQIPEWLQELLRNRWIRMVPTILAIIVFIFLILTGFSVFSAVFSIVVISALALLQKQFIRWSRKVAAGDSVKEENLTPQAVDNLPSSPDFHLTAIDEDVTFQNGSEDSTEATRFKAAMKDLHAVLADAPQPQSDLQLAQLENLHQSVITRIDPRITINRRVLSTLQIPPQIRQRIPDRVVPVMVHPDYSQPMYEPLRDLSTELLCPNIDLVPPNTLSLLVTNQDFIESYMLGLNHEMGRELLWREYPTDQRGSYFRQFWNVNDYVNKDPTLTPRELSEKLKDIPPVHEWKSTTELGTHNHREADGDATQLVLLVRGELLKRYPNAVIYAHRAEWQKGADSSINKALPRLLAPVETSQQQDDNEKYPLYSAQVEPDIFFIGFDLTVEEANGLDEDDPGWFFVLKERVGEPRFGLDINADSFNSWDDFNWEALKNHMTGTGYIELTNSTTEYNPADNPDNVHWHTQSNAADLAHILYQDPVLVAVHAEEMLAGDTE